MRKIYKFLGSSATIALFAMAFTSCVEETIPQSDLATKEEVEKSTFATAGTANGMAGYSTSVWNTESHCYFGYPAQMIIRDMLTGDYTHIGETGYSHFMSWNQNKAMGQDYMNQQFHWNFYYGFLSSANTVIRQIDEETATPDYLAYLGTAYAYRAMLYLDLARMYEFLPNEKFPDGKNSEGVYVQNLTVPIIDHTITEEEAANNPRATREEMFAFILADLDKAEELIPYLTNTSSNTLPDLACVYGLKARLYMLIVQYLAIISLIKETSTVPW